MNKINKDWKEVKLGDIVYFNPKESLIKGKIYKKVSMDCLKPKTREIIKYELDKFKGGSKFRNGDTLFARITPCLENGKIAQVSFLDNKEIGFGSTEFIVLREKENITLNDYIYYLFITDKIKNIAIKSMTGTSGRQRVQEDVLKYTIVKLPPLAEQKHIASILSALDDKIELNNKTNKILEEMAQTIFKEWFINFNFPNEDGKPYKKSGGEMIDSELGKIPKGWKIGTIGDYAKLKSGFAFKNSWWQNDGIPVIKIQNISSGNLNLEQCSFVSEDKYNIAENFRVNGGDLLITLTGSLGKFTIVPKLDKDALVNQRVGKFFLGEEPVKKLPFLYGILNELKDLIVSLANGSVQQNISPNDVENVKIIFPNDKILNKYNNLMQDIFYKIIFNQRENKKLSNIRDSLLPKLMTPKGRRADGEIRV